MSHYFAHFYNDIYNPQKKLYRLIAKGIQSERLLQNPYPDIRPLKNVNLILINVDSLYSSEMIMIKYLKSLVHKKIHVFKR
jgi:hypothetical protein